MAVITSIKQQKNKNRVNVYLDETFGFGIDLDNFVILNLKIGQELTEDEVDKIIRKAEFQKTLNKLLNFAMIRNRSEKEYRDYLYRKKVPEVIHKDLFSQLKNFGLINDNKFAKEFIESRSLFHPKPKKILQLELKQKGISKDIIDNILDNSEIDEEKIALNLLKMRESHWKRIEKNKRLQKMTEYLMRKGFSFDLVKRVTKDYNNE